TKAGTTAYASDDFQLGILPDQVLIAESAVLSVIEIDTLAGNSADWKIGDNAGANTWAIHDSDDSEVFYVDSNGNLFADGALTGVGAAITDDAASGYALIVKNDGDNDNRWGMAIWAGADTPNETIYVDFRDGDGDLIGNISDDSGLGFDAVSDKKRKKNIRRSTGSVLPLLRQMRRYDYDMDGNAVVGGLVAQRIEETLGSDAVTTRTFVHDDGSSETVMLIRGAFQRKIHERGAEELAVENFQLKQKVNLQRRQIAWMAAALEHQLGASMAGFPLE
ncbi:MAG: hypothetical protein ACTSX8_10985, partial [Alphaproteobacteria bacterium]